MRYDDYIPNMRETPDNAACELIFSLNPAKSLNPANATHEQNFKTIQLLAITTLIEEDDDDDPLYNVHGHLRMHHLQRRISSSTPWRSACNPEEVTETLEECLKPIEATGRNLLSLGMH